MYLCYLLPLHDILSYCYGTIQPICVESAVKPQTNKQTNKQILHVFLVYHLLVRFLFVLLYTTICSCVLVVLV